MSIVLILFSIIPTVHEPIHDSCDRVEINHLFNSDDGAIVVDQLIFWQYGNVRSFCVLKESRKNSEVKKFDKDGVIVPGEFSLPSTVTIDYQNKYIYFFAPVNISQNRATYKVDVLYKVKYKVLEESWAGTPDDPEVLDRYILPLGMRYPLINKINIFSSDEP